MKVFSLVILLIGSCYGYYIHQPTAMPVFEMDDQSSDCFFPVKLDGCQDGVEVFTYQNDEIRSAKVEKIKETICLPVKCSTGSKGNLALTHEVIIGGANIQSTPGILEPDDVTDLYKDKDTCESTTTESFATVKCLSGITTSMLNDTTTTTQEITNDVYYQDIEEEFNGKVSLQQTPPPFSQWNNWFKGILYINCGPQYALYYMKSRHSNTFQDRLYQFSCKRITNVQYDDCEWRGYQNMFNEPLSVHCEPDYIMVGLYAIYSDTHKDRRFAFQCCHAPGHYTRSCSLSPYLNDFGEEIEYTVDSDGEIFTGMHAHQGNSYKDRRFKISSCKYVAS